MALALFLVVLVVVVLVIVDLIRVVNQDNTDTTSTWDRRFASCRARIADIVPLTSIKILVVAWQIISQVNDPTGWAVCRRLFVREGKAACRTG